MRSGGGTDRRLERLHRRGRDLARAGELILGARWAPPRGPGSFSKIGTRNAMVIAVASSAFSSTRTVGRSGWRWVGRATRGAGDRGGVVALAALDEAAAWDEPTASLGEAEVERFGQLVAGSGTPIDDVRGTGAYRRHACAVLAPPTRGRSRTGGRLMLVRANVNGEWREADVARLEPPLSAARASRAAGLQERVRAGRVRLMFVWLDDELVCASPRPCGASRRTGGPDREGLAAGEAMHPVQEAFVESPGVQWFCTPGFVVAVTDLLAQRRPRSTPRSARPCRATSAAAPATRRSSRPCGSRLTA